MKAQTIKAYKVFNPDWTCKGFQYEIGKTYSIKDKPVLCERGFHACKKVSDCFSYYSFDTKNKVAEVQLSGIIEGLDGDKQCAQKITIIKEISWDDMLVLANSGSGNTGHSNSGDSNSGDWNSGDWNSGDRNSGDRNSGDSNSGDSNSGDWNSGDWNSGDRNSGDRNSGDSNSGDSNSGNRNSGNRNSGDSNSGDRNSGNRNSGDFNSTTPDSANFFNKPCKLSVWDSAKKPAFIYYVNPCMWINWADMNDDEKKNNKNAFITGGYLKVMSYKDAWAEAFKGASKKDIKLLKALPNFDAQVFEEITGIKIK